MKNIFSTLLLTFFALSASAQIGVKVQMGSTTHEFKGIQIFNNNESEETYYLVEDGVLHYYYVNNYEGKCIQFIHAECPTKSLDLKSIDYKDYDDEGQFMYIKTKKNAEAITQVEINDSNLSGPSEDGGLTTEEDMKRLFLVIINDKELAEEMVSKIKKG